MLRTSKLVVALFVLLTLGSASCTKQSAPGEDATATVQPEGVVISAAASTKEIVEALAEKFRASSNREVKVNTGPSNGLANQILAGAPADLFLSASEQWASAVQAGGQAEKSTKLLTNRLVLVAAKGNPVEIKDPKDLLLSKVKKIALASEKVPAGIYADQALAKLALLKMLTDEGKIVRGQDVRSALTYVERGEAEAGIVYSTDVAAAANVVSVYEFDPSLHDEIVYVLVLLIHGGKNPTAREFYDLLQSSAADEVYSTFGFSRIP